MLWLLYKLKFFLGYIFFVNTLVSLSHSMRGKLLWFSINRLHDHSVNMLNQIVVWLAGCVELISVRLQIINTYFYTVKLLFQSYFNRKMGSLYRPIWGHKNIMWLSSHRCRQVYMQLYKRSKAVLLVFRIISISSPIEILWLIDFKCKF